MGSGARLVDSGIIAGGLYPDQAEYELSDNVQLFVHGYCHGVILLGIAQLLRALPEVVEGLERWLRVVKGREETPTE